MKKEEMVYCLNEAKDLDFLKGSLMVSKEVTPASNCDFKIISSFITYIKSSGLFMFMFDFIDQTLDMEIMNLKLNI